MSLVNAETGELIAEMTPDEARQITERIRTSLSIAWELVTEAYQRRAWTAMGYPSWDAYCSAEFGAARLKLPREERQEVVHSLREAGLSIRAIAAATGTARNTVRGDLEVGQVDPPDDPDEENDVDVIDRLHQAAEGEKKITGTDGKTYKATDLTRERVARAKLLAADGKTVKEIANALDMTYEPCRELLERHGVEITAGNTRQAVAGRVAKAKEMAASGHTSRQIAEAIGLTGGGFTNLKAKYDIEVPADAVVGRARHHDSDRIVNETVSTLAGLVMGLDLVGDPREADLDLEQIDDWATSLSDSLRLLNRFSKQLKEMTQ